MNPTMLQNQIYLDEIAGGYRAAQVLFTACRLGVFEVIGHDALELETVVERLGSDRRGTRVLLDALVGMGLLEMRDGRYLNSALALDALLPAAPHSRIAQLLHGARLYERWAGLYDAVLTGQPVPDDRIDPRIDSGKAAFARAMADSARQIAATTAASLDLDGVSKLLDIGGGPGLYSIEFARRSSGLRAWILDDAETLRVAERNIETAGLGDRVTLLPGDAHSDDLGGPYDFIFISNVLHIYSGDRNRELIRRCAAALGTGGRLALKDFFLQDTAGGGKSGPLWNLLFAANMLAGTAEGDCYTEGEVRSWSRDAGLDLSQKIPLTERTSILVFRNQPRTSR
ncbi:MAG: methyltransferase dimerization domain-containing protein [Acidobacteriota bacterium]